MKVTAALKKELAQWLDTFWTTYFKGDIDTWATFIRQDYRNIGGTKEEVWNSKQEIVDYTKRIMDQMLGTVDIRNRQVDLIPYGDYMMVNEFTDLYVKIDGEWIFYGPFRMSSLLEKTGTGWIALHQHGSYPDMKAMDGEAFSVDALKAENAKLQAAVKSRTIELELEAALERVRAQAMGMNKPTDLLSICQVVFSELKALGFDELRNALIHTYHDEKKYFADYDYSDFTGGCVTRIPYSGNQVIEKFIKAIRKSKTAFSEIKVYGKQLADWKKFRKANNEADDPRLDNIDALYYYNYSVGEGSIGISTYQSITEEKLNILKRFRNVFDLAYKRYDDISRAESQAKEAQIEAALERVRARSMAMHKSEEFKEVIQVVLDQFVYLQIHIEHTGFILDYKEREDMYIWLADKQEIHTQITLPYFDCAHWNSFIEAKEKGLDFFSNHLDFEEKNKFYRDMFHLVPGIPEQAKAYYLNAAGLAISTVLLDNVGLYIENFSGTPYTDEENNTLMRFGKVFQQTYTRFLDLQKAEAQARDAEIELALERVRARTMAMQHSNELQDAAIVLFEQVKALGFDTGSCGFNIWHKDEKAATVWVSSPEGGLQLPFTLPHTGSEMYKAVYSAKQKGHHFFIKELNGENLKKHFDYLTTVPGIGEIIKKLRNENYTFPERMIFNFAFFKQGYLSFHGHKHYPDAQEIFKRFALVFEQTYTRFLDLQKAEEQAKEAHIEAAMERVRSRSIAMHRSDEIADIVGKIFSELKQLNLVLNRVLIWTFNDAEKYITWWSANPEVDSNAESYRIDYNDQPIFINYLQAWKQNKALYFQTLSGGDKKNWEDHLFENTEMSRLPLAVREGMRKEGTIFSTSIISDYGLLMVGSFEPLSDENIDIIQRFGRVFQQSYTRYLDVQKAEAQAREAQIEAALERVRSRSMAMHKTGELFEAAELIYKELTALDITSFNVSYAFVYEEKKQDEYYGVNPIDGKIFPFPVIFPQNETPVMSSIMLSWKKSEPFNLIELDEEELKKHQTYIGEHILAQLIKNKIDIPFSVEQFVAESPKTAAVYSFNFRNGYLFIIREKKLATDEAQIVLRFTKVFNQTYTRFLDLQKTEEQAREAHIEAALEKVRARGMSMHSSNELGELVTTLFKELTKLDVQLTSCLIWSHDFDLSKDALWVASSEINKPAAPFYIHPFHRAFFESILHAWRAKDTHWVYELQGKEKKDFQEAFLKEVPTLPDALNSILENNTNVFFSASFNHFGALEIISTEPLSEKSFDLLHRFGKVFNSTYTRFLDLLKAEKLARQAQIDLENLIAAKKKTDDTLTELKATQTQLIQAEKMASLGELTAGIAHEIQNPLNFVNNFSEVSNELLEEMIEEAANGNFAEVKEILNDVRQNLEKINYHGRRADAIVKGMLQHSRSSSGTKELTDINVLTDEYLRLAYHGLRAKDKSFNATMKTEFDKNIGNINIIPQDIGRVILNLITNAFYVVNEKKKLGKANYAPTVTVSTMKTNGMVEIKVADNGKGIPQKVLDKIFQPFFTTKPTGQGTGLGLSLAYDIVKAHGGVLKVETWEGEGSEFIINLPA